MNGEKSRVVAKGILSISSLVMDKASFIFLFTHYSLQVCKDRGEWERTMMRRPKRTSTFVFILVLLLDSSAQGQLFDDDDATAQAKLAVNFGKFIFQNWKLGPFEFVAISVHVWSIFWFCYSPFLVTLWSIFGILSLSGSSIENVWSNFGILWPIFGRFLVHRTLLNFRLISVHLPRSFQFHSYNSISK